MKKVILILGLLFSGCSIYIVKDCPCREISKISYHPNYDSLKAGQITLEYYNKTMEEKYGNDGRIYPRSEIMDIMPRYVLPDTIWNFDRMIPFYNYDSIPRGL